MKIGWKVYLRSGQVIAFTAEHDDSLENDDKDFLIVPSAIPSARFYAIDAIIHDAFKLSGSMLITNDEYDAARYKEISFHTSIFGATDHNDENYLKIATARRIITDHGLPNADLVNSTVVPCSDADGYILSWPDHITARC